MNLNFYIIHSIDIPIDLDEQWNRYEGMTTRELIDIFKEESIELPFDEYEEDDHEYDDIDCIGLELIPFAEYKETDEFYDEHYEEFREEMIELLINREKPKEEIENILYSNLPYYIINNIDKFNCTESDNHSDEFNYADMTTIHRKYVAQLNNEEFSEFIDEFAYNSTCDTMGSITEFGWLPSFSIEIESDNIEHIYISVLFNEELSEDIMEDIENKIRKAIEDGELTLDYLNNL
jgi:hypothetical protein